MTADQRRRTKTKHCHQRDHHDGVQGHVARILNVAAGQDRVRFRWPYPLTDPGRNNQRHQSGRREFRPACSEHGFQAALPEQLRDPCRYDDDRYPGQRERGGA